MSENTVPRHAGVPLIAAVLGVGFTAGMIPAGLLPSNVLNIERAYGLSHSEMGRIVGLCMVLGGASGGLIGGFVCRKVGALRVVLVALAIAACALASVGMARNLQLTIAGLAAYFFGVGLLGLSNVLATHMLPDRQRGIALMHAMNGVGKLAGPAIASVFLYAAWRTGFILAALVPLMLLIPGTVALLGGRVDSIGRKRSGDGHAGLDLWMAVTGFVLIGGAEIGLALWSPAYAVKARGFSATQGNMLLASSTAGFTLGRFLTGALAGRFTPRRMIGMCGVLLLFAIPAVSVSSFWAAMGLFLLVGVGYSTMWPSYFAHLSRIFPEHIGMMGGAAVFATQIGFAAGSWITGRIAETHLAYAILFAVALNALFAALFFLTPVSRAHASGGVS